MIFQVSYMDAKKRPDSPEHAGGKVSIAAALKEGAKAFGKDVEDFISTLTPGAQSAIRAMSFAWGLENAEKYVKNAMTLGDVKDADNMLERSHATIQSIQHQAAESHEKLTEVSAFAWGFYNEDMKAFQAQVAKSETIMEKDEVKDKEKNKEQEKQQVPASAQQAVQATILTVSANPSLIYCADALNVAQEAQQKMQEEEKKHGLLQLISVHEEQKRQEERIVRNADVELLRQAQENRVMESAVNMALERRDELLHEYDKLEKQLTLALEKLEEFAKDEKEMVKKVAEMLPRELANFLLSHEKSFSKRAALKRQLMKWLAFSRTSKKSLLLTSMDKLVKVFALSKLLK